MRFAGLVRHEVARLISRRMTAVVFAIVAGLMVVQAFDNGSLASTSMGLVPIPAASRLVAALAAASGFGFLWVFALGGTVAEDRTTGSLSMIVTRAGSRVAWLASKLAAASVLSAFMVVGLTLIAGLTAYSHGDRSLGVFTQTLTLDAKLAAASPLAYLFLAVVLTWLTTVAFCVLGIVAGLFTRSAFASQVLPATVWALSLFVGGRLAPATQAQALSSYFPTATMASTIGYWLAFITVLMGVGVAVCSLRGEA